MRAKPLILFICIFACLNVVFFLLQHARNSGSTSQRTNEGRQLESFLLEVHNNAAAKGHDASPEDLKKALEGIDRYSRYLDSDELNDFSIQTQQAYVGIGVRLAQTGSFFIVSEVFPGGPSALAGLLRDDRIASVDGDPISHLGVDDVVKLLRGTAGSEVDLLIYRPSEETHLPITITRGEVELRTVNDYRMLEPGIGYLRLDSFGLRSAAEVSSALGTLSEAGMEQLILDLRDNPGGVLTAGVKVADVFLESGTEVIRTKAARGSDYEGMTYHAQAPAWPLQYPIAVLISHHSASAAEIVAGALQQADRAILIGDRTIGKGSIQSVYTLPDGQGIKMTTAHYYLPNGQSIDGTGIAPDILLAISESEWMSLYIERTHRPRMSEKEYEARFPGGPPMDKQLDLAIETLKSRKHLNR